MPVFGIVMQVRAMPVSDVLADAPRSCAIDVRGPFDSAGHAARRDCILCAVDCSALRWFGAFAPVRRMPERRKRQIAEVARWLMSLDAHALIVLQAPSAQKTYLTQILECMQLMSPVAIHRPADRHALRCDIPQDVLHRCRANLHEHASGASLLRRIQKLNGLETGLVVSATPARTSRAAEPMRAVARAVVQVAQCTSRTLVLGDWFELAILRRMLERLAMPLHDVHDSMACHAW